MYALLRWQRVAWLERGTPRAGIVAPGIDHHRWRDSMAFARGRLAAAPGHRM